MDDNITRNLKIPMEEEKVFFQGINSLRFLAALAVIITHIELIKGVFGFQHHWNNPIIFALGGLGVCFFFVLSGFLITYLLLKEKQKYGTIHVKAFYVRRILRIWPLYYLILVLGFFILPHFQQIQIPYLQRDFQNHFNTNLLLYLLILPNVAFSLFTAVPHIGQLWSIGIEEQFYIAWPWIILKAINIRRALLFIIVLLLFIKFLVLCLGNFYAAERWYVFLKKLVAMSKFECMAIGGLGAYYLFNKKESLLRIIYKKSVLFLSILMVPVLVYFTPNAIQDGIHILFSVFFLVIILNVANSGKLLENPVLSYLGKISYGIYMYHLMIIPIVLFLYGKLHLNSGELLMNVLIYPSVIILTVIVSAISYEFFENKFIKLKKKYALVKSGPDT